MFALFEKTWDLVKIGSEIMCEEDCDIKFDSTKEKTYKELCEILYNKILEYMAEEESPLDRHKVAAIVMIAIIKSNILTSTKEGRFMGNYILAAEVGLSYLLKELNDKLSERGQKNIDKFWFPDALSCPTDYLKIFYRNLYFAHTNAEWNLNPLDMAERLFLLEYMTLEKNEIIPSILREY